MLATQHPEGPRHSHWRDVLLALFVPIMNLSDYYKFYGPQMRPRGIAEWLVLSLSTHLIVFPTEQHLSLFTSLVDALISTRASWRTRVRHHAGSLFARGDDVTHKGSAISRARI